ncbi:MAG: hypothetical protein AB7O97_04990 [Planctomycetota bacterium]
MRSHPRCSASLFLLLALAGCQVGLSAFTAPARVETDAVFEVAVTGTSTGGNPGDLCGCVLQVPNGFTVLGATFVGTSTLQAPLVADDPALLAVYAPEPGHFLASFHGQAINGTSHGGNAGTLTIQLRAPALVTADTVTLKVALAGQTGGLWTSTAPAAAGTVAFASVGSDHVRAVRFADRHVVAFGSACSGGGSAAPVLDTSGGSPVRGNPQFALTLAEGQPGGFGVLWVGADTAAFGGLPLPLALLPFGAPGCSLYVAPILQLAVPLDSAGRGALPLPIPNDPALQGASFHGQGAAFAPGANAAGLLFTGGLSVEVQ